MEQINSATTNTAVKKNNYGRKLLFIGLAAFLIIGSIAGIIYYLYSKTSIYVDLAEINAPQIILSSKAGGTLEKIMVKPGDFIGENTPLARIGEELIKSDRAGLVIATNNILGKNFAPGEAIVTMIYPDELRVVGHLSEDKGLKDVRIGQRVIFTVDSFGAKKYLGLIDEIGQVSNQSSVVFSISDKRPEKQFDVKARFNVNDYAELKEGMSAKMWINK